MDQVSRNTRGGTSTVWARGELNVKRQRTTEQDRCIEDPALLPSRPPFIGIVPYREFGEMGHWARAW